MSALTENWLPWHFSKPAEKGPTGQQRRALKMPIPGKDRVTHIPDTPQKQVTGKY